MLWLHCITSVSVAGDFSGTARVISKDDTTPLVVIIPGLTSDSASAVSSGCLIYFLYVNPCLITWLFFLKYITTCLVTWLVTWRVCRNVSPLKIFFARIIAHINLLCFFNRIASSCCLLYDNLIIWCVSQYVKHLAYSMASHGWNVVVSNHRGLAGMSITVSSVLSAIFVLFFDAIALKSYNSNGFCLCVWKSY